MSKFSGGYRVTFIFVLVFLWLSVLNVYSAQSKDSQDEKAAMAFKGGSATYYYNQGNDYKNKGDIPQAIANWSKAIEAKPDFAQAYYNRGNVFGKQDMLNEAIGDFTKAIACTTDQKLKVLAYYNRAVAYGKQEKPDAAIVDYTKAIEIDSKYAPAYKNRAVVYFYKKDYDLSWQDVHKSEKLGLKGNLDFIEELKNESGRSG